MLLVESTYGNRLHRSWPDTLAELTHAVTDTLARKGGNVIVPAFAIGRTQDLIYLLADLYRQGELPESIALHRVKQGAVIISASGMCEAGRIKHHLRHNLGRPECTIIIPGFQAEGTLGRRLVDGAGEVRIFGIPVPVRAEIYTIGGLSAHADQQGLLDWLAHFTRPPRATYVVHGEAAIAEIFASAVRSRLKWGAVSVPRQGLSVNP